MEFVFVVKRSELFDLSFPHGFVPRVAADPQDRVATWTRRIRERGFFVERRWAEKDAEGRIRLHEVKCGRDIAMARENIADARLVYIGEQRRQMPHLEI